MTFESILTSMVTFGIPIVMAVTLHEAAHGFVAFLLGDPTAKNLGRVTFNPLKHIDPVGTLLIPALLFFFKAPTLFGYAKPVPVRYECLRSPRRDMILVALAGPGMNFLLAFLSALLTYPLSFCSVPWINDLGTPLLITSIQINVVLGVFNMLPLPPLDGGRVAVGLLPPALGYPLSRLEPYGFLILLSAMMFLPILSQYLGMKTDFFSLILETPVRYIINLVLVAAGLKSF